MHAVMDGFGIHWRAAVLQINAIVLEPPGNRPVPQVRICGTFDVVAFNPEVAPETLA